LHATRLIPLFPLNIVLFPDSKIPLYIFEERYKILINDAVNNDSDFGINLIEDKKISTTGCTCKVTEVIKKYDNGEMKITVTGFRRFNLLKYTVSDFGYYIGEITELEEKNSLPDKSLIIKVINHYNHLVDTVYKGGINKIDLNDESFLSGEKSVSFRIAQKSGLTVTERLNLLEIDDENERLKYLEKYFDEIIPKLHEANRISSIIKSDGYLQ